MDKSFPNYSVPLLFRIKLVLDACAGSRHSFMNDARYLVSTLIPPLHVVGLEKNLPECGRLLLCNHYFRPGFPTYWLAFAIASQLPSEMHWMMTAAFTYERHPLRKILEPASRIVISRLSKIYGFSRVPPISGEPRQEKNSLTMHNQFFRYVRNHPNTIIGIAPEGRDNPAGGLGIPPSGTGKLILHLTRLGFALQAVGVYEMDGKLVVNFGSPFTLPEMENDGSLHDAEISAYVIHKISLLLPAQMIMGSIE